MESEYVIYVQLGTGIFPVRFDKGIKNGFSTKELAMQVLERELKKGNIDNHCFLVLDTYSLKEDAIMKQPPKFPLNRVINDSNWRRCDKCGSSMTKKWFGGKICDNKNCI